MTAQVPERLIDGGAVVKMVTCMSWPRSHPGIVASVHAPVGILHSTACGRGYQGTWEIRNGRLWLKSLKGCWNMASVQPIHAEWVTGVLHVWHGKVLDYVHMGFASLYERDELIGVRQGTVVGRAMIDNHDDPPPGPEVHYARLRAAMPDGLTRFADEGPNEDPPEPIEIVRCEIAGTGHHCDETTGQRMFDAPMLALVREPENEHDEDAIAVHCDGKRVGYIPRRHNTVLARLLDAGKCLQARVVSVLDLYDGPWLDAGIVVEMEG